MKNSIEMKNIRGGHPVAVVVGIIIAVYLAAMTYLVVDAS
ncbi:hypothetical protein BHECKSOX2_1091 [Bathymodiolus heckerae thiotrophic gill symbiont]|nr:hypothetical protein [uncultured Gammaproteobacteria bacterium]SMN13900.1 hypothetical protein BHECKSOX2_1091 [Bathymodiolus heckerae thiotrophic gill symbiont]